MRIDRAMESALEAVLLTHIEFVAAPSGVPRMIFGELQRAEDTAAKRMVRRLLRRYSERCRRIGQALHRYYSRAGDAVFAGWKYGPGRRSYSPTTPQHPLDSKRALAVVRILNKMARQYQTAIIVVTHDEQIIPTFKRIDHIQDGNRRASR